MASSTPMATVMERNISALLSRRQRELDERALPERIGDRVTAFTGSMTFVLIHLVLFGLWIVINVGWTPLRRFDPSLVVLAMFASVEAIFLSTFVLMTQNRMQGEAARRADLDLQISLLAEHETTRLISLVVAVAEHLGVEVPHGEELPELQQDVRPEQVLERMEAHEERLAPHAAGRGREHGPRG
jgi:uncharacterized membrane protein